MKNAVDKTDMRIRGTMLYHAAGTGRWGAESFSPKISPVEQLKT